MGIESKNMILSIYLSEYDVEIPVNADVEGDSEGIEVGYVLVKEDLIDNGQIVIRKGDDLSNIKGVDEAVEASFMREMTEFND